MRGQGPKFYGPRSFSFKMRVGDQEYVSNKIERSHRYPAACASEGAVQNIMYSSQSSSQNLNSAVPAAILACSSLARLSSLSSSSRLIPHSEHTFHVSMFFEGIKTGVMTAAASQGVPASFLYAQLSKLDARCLACSGLTSTLGDLQMVIEGHSHPMAFCRNACPCVRKLNRIFLI